MLTAETIISDESIFTSDASGERFFHGGHWGQCLELLNHLCQFSDSVLLVSGPVGFGKSTLKQALQCDSTDTFSCGEIQATASLDAASLKAAILAFQESNVSSDRDLIYLIDDAQNLTIDAMAAILQLKYMDNISESLHVVLFARPELQQRLQKSPFKDQFAAQVHTIDLEPLTQTEVEGFILQQWQLDGNHGPLPLDKEGCKKIYSLSGGVPGVVQQLAKSMMTGQTVKKSIADQERLSPLIVGLTVFLGLLLCVLAFLWPGSDEPDENKVTVASLPIPDTAKYPVPEPQLQYDHASYEARISRLEDKLIALQQQLQQEQEAHRVTEAKLLEAASKSQAQTQEQIQTQPENQSETQLQAQPEKQPETQLQAQAQAQAQAQPKAVATKVSSKFNKGEQYILNLPSKNYTIQLLGASSERNVQDFIKTNLPGKAHYFKSMYQGKPWFIVIYGNFVTRTAANSALNSLPSGLRKLQPWPRELMAIQRTIKKK